MHTMPHLFGPDGQAALARVLRGRPLLAFDFDGTLAPIVARPDDARPSRAVTLRLQALAALLPVAIVSGRAAADVRARLGFEPAYVMGNHGAEDAHNPAANAALAQQLDGLRARLLAPAAQAALAASGVQVEDKGASMALHYRLSPTPAQALATIDALLADPAPGWRIFGGKMVVNIAPADAPDKAQAVQLLVARSGATSAVFAGDDVNDEPVFAAAPPHWLTVRVGRDDPASRAQFCIEGPDEMALLLQRMLALLGTPA